MPPHFLLRCYDLHRRYRNSQWCQHCLVSCVDIVFDVGSSGIKSSALLSLLMLSFLTSFPLSVSANIISSKALALDKRLGKMVGLRFDVPRIF